MKVKRENTLYAVYTNPLGLHEFIITCTPNNKEQMYVGKIKDSGDLTIPFNKVNLKAGKEIIRLERISIILLTNRSEAQFILRCIASYRNAVQDNM